MSNSTTRQFVTFVVGAEVFAVDLAPVQEIIRVPQIVAVPLAPASLDGLANLRGRILPIASLRRIFRCDERAHDDATRAVVIDLGQPMGFIVDRVTSVVNVEPAQIESPEAIDSTVDVTLLSGILKDVGGHKMVMVLDFARLIATHFAAASARAQSSGTQVHAASQDAPQTEQTAVADELQLVSFEVAEQEYAIPIEHVQEIVQMPAAIVCVPHAKSHVLGVMTLRSRLLPLASLRRMLGLAERAADEQSRIVVVTAGDACVGVVMDKVKEVLRVPRACVDPLPSQLTQGGGSSDIREICRLDNGKRVVSILSVDTLFQSPALHSAMKTVESMNEDRTPDVGNPSAALHHDEEEQMVIFRLGKEEFGVPIESVQEIVRVPETMTSVPKAPPEVEGVINLRGTVLPVIDLRRRLGLATIERSDRQRIIVLLLDGVRTGYIVDQVAEVLKISRAAIARAPALTHEDDQVLARMANLDRQKRLVQLIDPEHLIEKQRREQLAQLAAA